MYLDISDIIDNIIEKSPFLCNILINAKKYEIEINRSLII